MIIVIDGPAGSGKSSTARAVADKLGIEYLDSGALYRALTLIYNESNKDREFLFEQLDDITISFNYDEGFFRIYLGEREVTEQIRTVKVAQSVSEVATLPKVRAFVNELMRKKVLNGRYIAEGRDLGTVVFPDADLKFFMSADLDERARRRFRELKERHPGISLSEVKKNIIKRDRKDIQRASDPLLKAEDAIEINTTNVTFEQQVEEICSAVTHIMKERNTP